MKTAPPDQTGPLLAQALPGQLAEDASLIDTVAAAIRQAYDRGGLATMLKVGEIVLVHLFDGNVANFRSGEKKHASYRAVARRDDIGISASNLWYAVALHDNVRVLGSLTDKLSPSHHRLLVHIEDEAQRTDLAYRAFEEGLSVRELESLVKAATARDPEQPRLGRPPLPAAVKHFGEVERAVTKLGTLPEQAVMYLTPEDAADLRKRAVALRKSLKAWIARIDAEAPKGSEREN